MPRQVVRVETIGFKVYVEWSDGFVLCAMPRPTQGGGRLPALGVENYVYIGSVRGDAALYHGARPLLPSTRTPTDAELAALRDATRQFLACVDAYGEVLPDPATLYRDARGRLMLVRCPWAFALLARRPIEGRATCTSGTDCACAQEDPPCEGPLTPADAASAERYWHAAACAAGDALA